MPIIYHLCGEKIAYATAKPERCPSCHEPLDKPFPVATPEPAKAAAPKRRWNVAVEDEDPEGTDTGADLNDIRPTIKAERSGGILTVQQLREQGGGDAGRGPPPMGDSKMEGMRSRSDVHKEYLQPLLNAAQAAEAARAAQPTPKPTRKRSRRSKGG